ncbi:hypothetical protein KOR34_21750 [Posidoniimonas corsicana]|uniref:Carboxypeptidase regulatory-like domain-containing protein n=1 Tax=Posidoniimonas corsicana TaxID=1938618 RepID=A0A5C5VF02_9BACT|nr:carboxypeptidase-like regulatory domain-containing protein [Posidoniimonas corsicana]TWT37228.1 hypothetical protein KOR34_21750 [Posidoniimonas corsicana]
MPLSSTLPCRFTALAFLFGACVPAWGQATRSHEEAILDEVKSVRREVESLNEKIDRLEKLLQGDRSSGDFSAVRLRVESPDGTPLEGFRVRLTSGQQGGRRIEATGVSSPEGVALDRRLPYGEYRLRVDDPQYEWGETFRSVMIEPGVATDRVIVAPDPSLRATVRLESELDFTGLKGLRFGTLRRPSGAGVVMYDAPEPGEESDRWETFPRLGDGISFAGVIVRVSSTQTLPQPDGEDADWITGSQRFLLTRDKAYRVLDTDGATVDLPDEGSAFRPNKDHESESTQRYDAGYLLAELEELDAATPVLELAAGDAQVMLTSLVGRATDDVARALRQRTRESTDLENPTVWLTARIDEDSAWVPRFLKPPEATSDGKTSEWAHGESGIMHIVMRTVELPPGDEVTLRIESP